MPSPQQRRFPGPALTGFAALCSSLLFFAVLAVAVPASADTAVHPVVAAAVTACSNSPASVKSRLETLAAANFTMTSDSQLSRELSYMRRYYPGLPRASAERKLKGFLFARTEEMRDPKPFAFGSALDPEAILAILQNEHRVYFILEALDIPISLELQIGGGRSDKRLISDFGFGCHFTLPDPVPETFLESLIPSGARVVDENSHANGASQVRKFDIDGRSTTIELIDMTRDPDIIAVPKRAGSTVRVAGLLRMGVHPVVLDDSKPRFRKVTP